MIFLSGNEKRGKKNKKKFSHDRRCFM